MTKLGKSPQNLEPTAIPPRKDALQLLKAGAGFLLAGIVSVLLIKAAFGGLGPHGPHTTPGWVLLVLALTCLPLGVLLSLLGGAKWLGRR